METYDIIIGRFIVSQIGPSVIVRTHDGAFKRVLQCGSFTDAERVLGDVCVLAKRYSIVKRSERCVVRHFECTLDDYARACARVKNEIRK